MRINGLNGANTPVGGMNMTKATDSVSKNIQNQIANAQKQLQELSANKDMSIEEKMKKRQEIQQQITDLNNQLRQHQIEQRKEQQAKKSSMDDMLGGSKKTAPKAGKQSTGLSQASMKAMISADSAMAQAQVQGSVATKKQKEAEEKGIDFRCKFMYPTDTGINAFDVSVILNNAITNAFEGVNGCKNPYVSISAYRKKNAYMLELTNCISKRVEIDLSLIHI